MKKFIHKINQYLLERYPNIWNTKVVWMLGISTVIHIAFYILGFIALSDVETLHQRRAVDMFFDNGTIFFSILISIIVLVIWLTQMFKNNGFKNFYPTSRNNLFTQFVFYFIIIFTASTFYFSYMFGLKHYTNLSYPDHTFQEEVKNSNAVALFLSHDLHDYTISNRKYPSPYDSIYCETNDGLIDKSDTYLSYHDKNYQFYTLYPLTVNIKKAYEARQSFNDYVYFKDTDSLRTYYYKNKILKVNELTTAYDNFTASTSDSIKYEAKPSYFNFSNSFYTPQNGPLDLELDYFDVYNTKKNTKKKIARNKQNRDLLLRHNSEEIKTLLSTFLGYCKKYKIENNLSLDDWYNIISSDKEYKVTALIGKSKPISLNYKLDKERTELEKHIHSITTEYYIRSDDLENVYENIDTIKNRRIINEALHAFLWISFFLTALIFCFRVSDLKTFIFSVIGGGVLFLFTMLFIAIYEYISRGDRSEYFAIYFTLIITTIVLVIPIFYNNKVRKTVVGVFMNLSIVGFVPYVLLVFGIITTHQSNYCSSVYLRREDCFVLLEDLGLVYTSIIMLVSGFIFIYLYMSIIKKWRALPER